MKYNSIENAEVFATEQIAWCKANGIENFTIWSNGKELHCTSDDLIFRNIDLKNEGFWKAIRFEGGHRVDLF